MLFKCVPVLYLMLLLFLQKKSREESEGEGSAVEILENHPYEDGPNGSGQYTYKVCVCIYNNIILVCFLPVFVVQLLTHSK